jgi:hypothetical protein
MNIDSAFAIGSSHEICQDYAVCVNNDVVVSDGCSSSKHSDIGARIIANLTLKSSIWGYLVYHHYVVMGIKEFLQQNPHLPTECMDATFLHLAANEAGVRIRYAGDGYIIAKFNNGTISVQELEYDKGYPRYISYFTNKERMDAYRSLQQNLWLNSYWSNKPDIEKSIIAEDKKVEFTFSGGVESITITTDGLKSMTRKDGRPTTILEIARDIIDYKNKAGRFVQRRLNRIKEIYNHYDDLAIGAVIL